MDPKTLKHKSASATTNEISQQFYWKTILRDAKQYVSNCNCSKRPMVESHKSSTLIKVNKTWNKLLCCLHGPFPTANGELKVVFKNPSYISFTVYITNC